MEFVDRGEESTTCKDIINKSNQKDEEGADLNDFTDLIGNTKKGNQHIMQVKWNNGETTWGPMKLIKECDPYTLAKYAHEKNTTKLKGWK